MPNNVDRMTGGFYIWCILYSDEREITLNPEYWVCGWGRSWWLVVVVMVVVVDISRYFPIETDWCPSQHFHHQTSQHPPRHREPTSLCWTVADSVSSLSTLPFSSGWFPLTYWSENPVLFSAVSSLLLPLSSITNRREFGWEGRREGGTGQIFYHNYLLNQAVSPFTSHSLDVME